jgi:hypothetical protein
MSKTKFYIQTGPQAGKKKNVMVASITGAQSPLTFSALNFDLLLYYPNI